MRTIWILRPVGGASAIGGSTIVPICRLRVWVPYSWRYRWRCRRRWCRCGSRRERRLIRIVQPEGRVSAIVGSTVVSIWRPIVLVSSTRCCCCRPRILRAAIATIVGRRWLPVVGIHDCEATRLLVCRCLSAAQETDERICGEKGM